MCAIMSMINRRYFARFAIFLFVIASISSVDNESVDNSDDSDFVVTNDDNDMSYESYETGGDHSAANNGNGFLDKLLAIYEKNSNLEVTKSVQNMNQTMNIIDRLVNISVELTSDLLTAGQLTKIVEIFFSIDIPVDCLDSMIEVVKAVRREELWAVKFLDSMGRIPTGIAEGTVAHFGEYDECIGIESPTDGTSEPIRGQYCLAKVILPFPSLAPSDQRPSAPLAHKKYYDKLQAFLKNYNMDNYLTVFKLVEILNNQKGSTFRFGTCMPSVCRPEDIENLINKIVYPITQMPIELAPDCYVKNQPTELDYFQKFSLFCFATLIVVSVSCNIIEIGYKYYKSMSSQQNVENQRRKVSVSDCDSPFARIVLCFSLTSNIKLLFANTGPKRFVCIDAIRFVLIINVCVDHMYLFTPFLSTIAFRRILNSVITKVYVYNKYFFARNILIIDTMFIISGLLVSYGLYGKLHRTKGKFNYLTYLIRLWLKYSVPMFIVLQLFWLFPLTGDGPIWNYGVSLIMPSCKDNYSLFSSFFFFSNYRIQSNHNVFQFGPAFAICNPPTWFLSALFQLQLIAPIVVLVLYKYPKAGISLTLAIITMGCYASISPRLLFDQKTYLDPLGINSLEDMTEAFVAFHMGINQYIISFFIGILIGYFVRTNISYKYLSHRMESLLWLLSSVTIALTLYWYMTLSTINASPSMSSVLLWFSFGKLMACIAISWILFSLCIGRAAFLEKVFSWYGFQVVSRLSFGIYVLHFLPLSYRLFSVRDTYVMTDKLLIEYITIDFIISAFIAFLFYILIERPFNNLFTLLFERKCDEEDSLEVTASNNTDQPIDNTKHVLPQINVFTANCHEIYSNKI